MMWRPIDTAPKDGTWVLLRGGDPLCGDWTAMPDKEIQEVMGQPLVCGFWLEPKWGNPYWAYCYWDLGWRSEYANPTHWRPIPEDTEWIGAGFVSGPPSLARGTAGNWWTVINPTCLEDRMSSPTQRTLSKLKREGWLAAVVEKWNPHARIRQDLFGIVDILAIREGETLAVQATGSGVSARIRKIADHESTPWIRKAGWRLEVWGWRKNAKGRWECRIVDVS